MASGSPENDRSGPVRSRGIHRHRNHNPFAPGAVDQLRHLRFLPMEMVLVAMLDLVPIVGSVTGATVVCVVCLATSLDVGIAAVIFYVIYELAEGYAIYPRVMRSSVDVPEYVTIIAVLAGGALGGVVGALLALPIAAAVLLLAREVWVRRQDLS